MNRLFLFFITLLTATTLSAQQDYHPSPQNLQSRAEFRDMQFGIFIHWGIYSVFGQGEWYLSVDSIAQSEYAKAAGAFYPIGFDADEWVRNIKAAGAKYICFTSRHHDGFSMWNTKQSSYNIVEATPFRRDVLKELADACHKQGIRLHLYYSLVDWGRDDYPLGQSGRGCGKDTSKADYAHYHAFMMAQLTELLTEYGEIGAIWFDGEWDHEGEAFDWRLDELYALVHRLQPACLIANNHHHANRPGEDIQCFERDVPGENLNGYEGKTSISQVLPLETCQTMNYSWGYNARDIWYRSVEELVTLRQNTKAKGANLLLNIGPRPDGRLPETALQRLEEMKISLPTPLSFVKEK